MAGFGVSAIDIAKAISLAKDIYDKCYTETPASTRYREFLNAIKALADSLARLKAVVQQHEIQQPHRAWHAGSPQLDESKDLWERLMGDFYSTLRDCESVLARQGYLKDGRQRTIDNLRWWFSAEDTVDKLSARLRRHVQSIDFFTKPAEFETMVRHGREFQSLRRQLANMEQMFIHGVGKSPKPGADLFTPGMEARIQFAFEENRPEWSTTEVVWPLKESFQAFTFHFARGTVKYQPQQDFGQTPSAVQYLELLKSAWILDQLRQSQQFQAVSIESGWANFMREFEDDIRGQQNRFEIGQLERPSVEELSRLQIGHFGIRKGVDGPPDPFGIGVSGIPEEKILELRLIPASKERESTLSVFRQTDSDFRLMASTSQTGALAPSSDTTIARMDTGRLVPMYYNPKYREQSRYGLVVLDSKGAMEGEYNFTQAEDVQKLQRAFTGFRVHHQMRLHSWCVNGSSRPGDSGSGMLQLWQCKSLPSIADSSNPQPADAASSLNKAPPLDQASSLSPSFGLPKVTHPDIAELATTRGNDDEYLDYSSWSGFVNAQYASPSMRRISQNFAHMSLQNDRRDTVLSGTTMNGEPSSPFPGRTFSDASKSGSGTDTIRRDGQSKMSLTTSASVMSPVKGGRTDGTQLLQPQLPALIILTEIQGKYSFVHLTLETKVLVQPKSCGCRKKDNKCNRVILEPKTKRDPFSLRILSAQRAGNEGLRDWDISAFRHPPAPEKLKKTVLREDVRVFELQFADHLEKELFLEEWGSLMNVRTTDQNEYEQSLRVKARKAAKPSSKS